MSETATYVYEIIDRQISSGGGVGSESEIRDTISIVRKDSAFIPLDTEEENLIVENVLRAADTPFYNGDDPPAGSSWHQFARYRGHTLRYGSDKYSVFADRRWTTPTCVFPVTPSELDTGYQMAIQTEFNSRQRNMIIYRTGWATNPPAASDASADIGGTAVTGGFQGQSWLVSQIAIRVRITKDASYAPMLNAVTDLQGLVGSKNSQTFMGCAANSCICEGVSVTKTGQGTEVYEIVAEFLFDPWYHHEQVATAAADGNPKLTSTGPAEVKWKRLPRTSNDFNDIFVTPMEKTLAENGWWE